MNKENKYWIVVSFLVFFSSLLICYNQNYNFIKNKINKNTFYLKSDIERLEQRIKNVKETVETKLDTSLEAIKEVNNKQFTKLDSFDVRVTNSLWYLDNKMSKPSYEYLKGVTTIIRGLGTKKKVFSYYERMFKNKHTRELISDTEAVEWMGTGSIIKETQYYTYILTNHHVAKPEEFDKVELFIDIDGVLIGAELVDVDKKYDLAIIKVAGKLKGKQSIKGLSLATPQEQVYVAGNHLGRQYIYGEGVFAGYDYDAEVVQLPCMWGNSGSGVFNKNGELVCVVFAINVIPTEGGVVADVAHAMCVPGSNVINFVTQTLIKEGV